MTLVHGVAVTAATVQLAKVLDGEIRDRKAASTVVLEDLVLSTIGTTAANVLESVPMLIRFHSKPLTPG